MTATATPLADIASVINATGADANLWTSRDGRIRRVYINEWAGLVGIEITRYGTGSVSHARLDGQQISNASARRCLNAIDKAWIAEDGTVHVTGAARDDNGLRERLASALNRIVAEAA